MTELLAADVMGFAGGFSAGVDQAGFTVIAKREPAAFGGFGVPNHVYNMPWLDAQVSKPENWELPEEQVQLVYGCPPCSGFSALSFANTNIHGAVVGPDAEINECMVWLVDYAARVKPEVVILESVAIAFKNGREWMEGLWSRLRERSGVDYRLTHVVMNAALVGGDAIRPRYFMVAHTGDFGVGLDFVAPRSAWEVLSDLANEEDERDLDWGHMVHQGRGADLIKKTIVWLKENGRDWLPGTRLPDNNGVEAWKRGEKELLLEPPEMWIRADGKSSPRNPLPWPVRSHYFSTDPFSTYRWRPERPYGVVVGAVLDRAVHPVHDRTFTYREAARFVSLPDDWSLRRLVEAQSGAELGKAVPSASGKWIAHWARMSIEGTPGEFAGIPQENPDIRVIDVRDQKRVDEILRTQPGGSFYTSEFADPDPATWLIDRRSRPPEWPQREYDMRPPEYQDMDRKPRLARGAKRVEAKPDPTVDVRPREHARTRRDAPPAARDQIERIPPDAVASLLSELGLSKQQAAEKLGVSVSRVNELVGTARPRSWLNAARWPEVQEALRG